LLSRSRCAISLSSSGVDPLSSDSVIKELFAALAPYG
jgi:hypothetical protein